MQMKRHASAEYMFPSKNVCMLWSIPSEHPVFCWMQDWTPLHSAVSAGHADIVQALISLHADVNVANSSGQTPLHYAVRK